MSLNRLALPQGERLIKLLCLPLLVWGLAQLVLTLAGLPGFIQRVSTLSLVPYHFGTLQALTNQAIQQAAAARGMTVPGYAIYYAVFNGSLTLINAALAGLIFWKARRQAFGWFATLVLLFLSPYPLVEALRHSGLLPPILIEAGSAGWPLVILFFFVFPNGQVQPGWARWPVGFLLTVHLAGQVFGYLTVVLPGLQEAWDRTNSIIFGAILANFVLILGCQVYRYRTVSTPMERQQTKVFLVGLGMMVSIAVLGFFWDFAPFNAEVNTLTLVFVPLAVAISILRYRLWDIDLIIRRTLLYALLSGLLGLVYFSSVLLLRQLLGGLAGESSPALVLSTLLIAALFNPLRRRLQLGIDRRFYRPKYDAARALEGFSAVVRNEVELEALTGSLAAVVAAAIQPQSLSLWIKPASQSLPAGLAAGAGDSRPIKRGMPESSRTLA